MIQDYLKQEIPNASSIIESITAATMVGIASNSKATTVIGVVGFWIWIDFMAYGYKIYEADKK